MASKPNTALQRSRNEQSDLTGDVTIEFSNSKTQNHMLTKTGKQSSLYINLFDGDSFPHLVVALRQRTFKFPIRKGDDGKYKIALHSGALEHGKGTIRFLGTSPLVSVLITRACPSLLRRLFHSIASMILREEDPEKRNLLLKKFESPVRQEPKRISLSLSPSSSPSPLANRVKPTNGRLESHAIKSLASIEESNKENVDDNLNSGQVQSKTVVNNTPNVPVRTIKRAKRVMSLEQKQVVRSVLEGHNVFFTGGAGTGKSFLLKELIRRLPENGTFVTASTGVAASQLGKGMTIHHFAGCGHGLGTVDVQQLISNVRRGDRGDKWRNAKVLIIDEISMIDSNTFDALDEIAKALKGNNKPFGGIQLVLAGDFFQLPPVSKWNAPKKFCFESKAWSLAVGTTISLKSVYRQSEGEFIAILEKVRRGICNDVVSHWFREKMKEDVEYEENGILPTRLVTHRCDVEFFNEQEIERLDGLTQVYTATDSGDTARLSSCPTREKLVLKTGAQVILNRTINPQEGLVNGARGVVVQYQKKLGMKLPIVRFLNGNEKLITYDKWSVHVGGREVASRTQLPLDLAYAVSIHKSQGMTLDLVEISLSKAFECGQAYVALSRVRTTGGLRILDFDESSIRANPTVVEFMKKIENQGNQRLLKKRNLFVPTGGK